MIVILSVKVHHTQDPTHISTNKYFFYRIENKMLNNMTPSHLIILCMMFNMGDI